MYLVSHLAQRLLRLPRPITRKVKVTRDIPITMPDGGVLLADHWRPSGAALPTMLIRTPYGRGNWGGVLARIYAERGFQVVNTSVRGTFGSHGDFRAMRHEREDGLATIEWVTRQPWFDGTLALAGPSYLGYTQWAVAADAPPEVKAMVPHVSSSRLALAFLPRGGFGLDTSLRWSVQTARQERRFKGYRENAVRQAMNSLPMADADLRVLGERWPFYQDCVHHDNEDSFWKDWDHSTSVSAITVPTSLVAGWEDIFLSDQIADFTALQRAGRRPRLIIGPWQHASLAGFGVAVRETVEWAGAHCRGEEPPRRAPVRLFVVGAGEWRHYETWPPEGYAPRDWHLHGDGGLRTAVPAASEPSRYRYDPADPTPSVGGPLLTPRGAGRKDNRALEARSDVLTFTCSPLTADLEIIGEVGARIWLRSSRPDTGVFVRLCDVDSRGRSVNVCDGLVNVKPDGVTQVSVPLSPIAYRFARGHRVRVQVSSGAHPRFARNTGSGEHHAVARTLFPADQEVFHSPEHPSAITLPTR
ncbi:CocE/NonD family hydrolase [Allokutzneria sp. A3M-2-11 16]|uniref:CocE/NonD family hydrolase n=1 Tax=Allokutzneria sp. A3M-2-11 16 TaxID=2962043 RepID=UPI0020B6F82F|nr:CocE/NonD family hydrolase [Allokutzneria sp. A3M-2-11 16]MCP3805224.1 CocE/NonD family hydrolase [Allokutzneria sp. A3M-2-11 16]